jgi:NADH:ubiquinone oxidoreductase subunit F (NADH-binding)/(2Fe-2S) ferredoxin
MALVRAHILICTGTGCTASGAKDVLAKFDEELKAKKLRDEVSLVETGCHGFCEGGPLVIIYPEGTFYTRVKPADVAEIVEEHILKGRTVSRLLFKEPLTAEKVPNYDEIAFYKKQHRLVLKNCGHINPDSIEEYIGADGYEGLAKAILTMTPEQVVEEMKKTGLRGRGGGGFPTGMKWMFCAKSPGPKKYVICNADEGDPGAFMDRSLLEGDPHAILEGMAICAYAIGSDEGYIYCRAEYPLAIKRLKKAIAQAEEAGLLGQNILGTNFSFTLHIKEGAGAFVCGEETALMASIEGRRGMPRPRPPFPAVKGLWDKPSNINNVETFANVPYIFRVGAEEYAKLGTEKSKGTKVFALTGKINNTGLAEVPMGITMREIIFDIGGGIIGGKKFKAVQIGGPSGGCIPEQLLDTPIDYDSLIAAGAMMGSGGLVVMDEDTCMVDVAKFFPTSHSLNPAANAPPAVKERSACSKCSPPLQRAKDRTAT